MRAITSDADGLIIVTNSWESKKYSQNYKKDRMENGIKGSRIWYNLRQRGGYARAVLARLPPPHPTPAQGCCEIQFCVISQNLHEIFNFVFAKFSSNFAKNKIIFNLAKLEKNLAKHEIKNFAKISRNYENENFAATLLLHNLPSATHPPLPSARRFFNAVRQCYFEMKPNKEPCFSILSIILLWLD